MFWLVVAPAARRFPRRDLPRLSSGTWRSAGFPCRRRPALCQIERRGAPMSDPQSSTPTAAPQPEEGDRGGTIAGPRNLPLEQENPDLLVPPSTDSGTLANLRFSFADAHMRLQPGGWAREVTVRELPISTTMAGVNMRLDPGNPSGVREMHWH